MLVDGITYMHEHTTIDLSEIKNNEDCQLDVFSETVREYTKLYDKGVRNIIDVTNFGMGRNTRLSGRRYPKGNGLRRMQLGVLN